MILNKIMVGWFRTNENTFSDYTPYPVLQRGIPSNQACPTNRV